MPPIQVQRKTSFRLCKDFFSKDFKSKSIQYVYSEEFDKAIEEYANTTFKGLMEELTESEKKYFLGELVLPIFAHRRDKGLNYLA